MPARDARGRFISGGGGGGSSFGGRIELNNRPALLAMRQVSIASTRMASVMATSLRGAFASMSSFATGVSSALRTTSQGFSRMSTRTALWGAAMTGTFALITRASFGMQKEMGALASLGFTSFEKMERGALNLAATFESIRARDVVAGAYDIQSALASLGDDAVIELSKINALVAKATIADAKQTADLMTGVYASFSDSMKAKGVEFGKAFAGVTAAAVKQFKLTGPKIAAFFENAGASAAAAGFKFEETTAILGVLGQQIGGAEAGTAFRFLLDNIGLVQMKMDKLAKTRGIKQVTFFDEDRVKKLPQLLAAVDQAMQAISQGMEKTAANAERAEIKSMLFGARGGKVFNILRTKLDQLTQAEENLIIARTKGISLAEDMARLMDATPAAQVGLIWQKLGVIIDKISLKLGKMLMPYIKQLNKSLDRVIKFVDANEEAFATIVKGIGAVGVALLGMAAGFKGASIVTGILATAFAAIAIPLAAVGVVVGAIIAAFGGLTGIIAGLITIIPAVVSGFTAVGSALAAMGLPAIIALVVALGVALVLLPRVLTEIKDIAGNVFSDMANEIQKSGERIGSTFIPILKRLAISMKAAFGGIIDAFKAQDYKLAGEIAMTALDLAILKGTIAITVAWRKFVDELGELLISGLKRAALEATVGIAKILPRALGLAIGIPAVTELQKTKGQEQRERDKADLERSKKTAGLQLKLDKLVIDAKQKADVQALVNWKAGAAREQAQREKRLAALNKQKAAEAALRAKIRQATKRSAMILSGGGKSVTNEFGKVLNLAGQAADKFKQARPTEAMRDVLVNVTGGLDEFAKAVGRGQPGAVAMPAAGMMGAVQAVGATTQVLPTAPMPTPAAAVAPAAASVIGDILDVSETNVALTGDGVSAIKDRLSGMRSRQDEIAADVMAIRTEPQL